MADNRDSQSIGRSRSLATLSYSYGNQGGGSSWFGPLAPMPAIAPPEVAGRRLDYQSGFNLIQKPRSNEAITFEMLRAFADNYDLLRLVIETRKDEMARQKWDIVPRDHIVKDDHDQYDAQILKIKKFFLRPDKKYFWDDWLRMLLEDLFVLDAPAIYKRKTYGGDLVSLEAIDGSTIKRVIDDWGNTPSAPSPAYQQVIKGLPAIDYTEDELIYRPRNIRTNKVYGMSPVEQIVMTINIGMRRQIWQLQSFTEGNIPEALIGTPSTWTSDQIQSFQDWFDMSLVGNTGERRRARFVPGDIAKGGIHMTKTDDLFGAADEWLARVVCFAFSVSPLPFLKMMNRATADTAREQAVSDGLAPVMNWVKGVMDTILLDDFKTEDLEFIWDTEEELDPKVKSEIILNEVKGGIRTVNEGRQELGLDVMQEENLNRVMVLTPAGYVPVAPNAEEKAKQDATEKQQTDQQGEMHDAKVGALKTPPPVPGVDPKSPDAGVAPKITKGAGLDDDLPFPRGSVSGDTVSKWDEDSHPRDEHGRFGDGGGASVNFEVAPDPHDRALTASWESLSSEQKQDISDRVADKIVPEALHELGLEGEVQHQIGGYMGYTNPSLSVEVNDPDKAIAAAGLIGHALSQDSMMVVSERGSTGYDQVGIVSVTVPEGQRDIEQVTALYDRLYGLKDSAGNPAVGGFTMSGGELHILNFSGDSTPELSTKIDSHLGGEYNVNHSEGYAAFVDKEQYHASYAPDGSSPLREAADRLRNEASTQIRTEIAKAQGLGKADWDEGSHPRDGRGRFGSGDGSGDTRERAAAMLGVDARVATVLSVDQVMAIREAIASKADQESVLAAMKPLYDTMPPSGEHTLTLTADGKVPEGFFEGRTYNLGPKDNPEAHTGDVKEATARLISVADAYAKDVGVGRDKEAIILVGPSAAGKSGVAEVLAAQGKGYAIVDSDDAKKMVPGFDGGLGANAVHEESSAMARAVEENMMREGKNIILPVVGSSQESIDKRLASLSLAGYKVTIVNVNVDKDEATRRMAGRALSTGRVIGADYSRKVGNNPTLVYNAVKERATHYVEIDANGKQGTERISEASRGSGFTAGKPLLGKSAGGGDGFRRGPVLRKVRRSVRVKASSKYVVLLERPFVHKVEKKLQSALAVIMHKAGVKIAAQVVAKMNALAKADWDEGNHYSVLRKDDISDDPIPDDVGRLEEADYEEEIDQVLEEIDFGFFEAAQEALEEDLGSVYADSGELAAGALGIEEEAFYNRVNGRALKWAKSHAADLVGTGDEEDFTLGESTREMLRAVIVAGIEENLSTKDIGDKIRESHPFSEGRALTIAATEITAANSNGALDSYMDARGLGLSVLKSWLVLEDGCPVCEGNADDGAIELEAEFSSGDMAPGAHPHCRCVLVPVAFDPDTGDEEEDPADGEDLNAENDLEEAATPAGLTKAEWDEGSHPRDDHGRFGEGGGGGKDSPLLKERGAKLSDYPSKIAIDGYGPAMNKDLETTRFNVPVIADRLEQAFPESLRGGEVTLMTMEKTSYSDPGVALRYQKMDENGITIANVTRVFYENDKGEIRVDHALFQLDPTLEGQGIAKEFLGKSMNMYQEMGVKEVSVHANINVGGYAWAKYGFIPEPRSWDNLRDGVQRTAEMMARTAGASLEKAGAYGTAAAYARIGGGAPEAIWGVADSSVGKELLMGRDWQGKLDLSNKEAMDRFNHYTGRKG